jgi:hypothetical protein
VLDGSLRAFPGRTGWGRTWELPGKEWESGRVCQRPDLRIASGGSFEVTRDHEHGRESQQRLRGDIDETTGLRAGRGRLEGAVCTRGIAGMEGRERFGPAKREDGEPAVLYAVDPERRPNFIDMTEKR